MAKDIETLLSPNQFLYDSKTKDVICSCQTYLIDPDVVYEVAGFDLSYCEWDQVWDCRLFEWKTAQTLMKALKAEDPNLIELPRVVENPETGLKVSELSKDWMAP